MELSVDLTRSFLGLGMVCNIHRCKCCSESGHAACLSHERHFQKSTRYSTHIACDASQSMQACACNACLLALNITASELLSTQPATSPNATIATQILPTIHPEVRLTALCRACAGVKADANRSVHKRAAWVLTQALGPEEASRGKWQIYLELLPLLNEYGLHLIQVGILACLREPP